MFDMTSLVVLFALAFIAIGIAAVYRGQRSHGTHMQAQVEKLAGDLTTILNAGLAQDTAARSEIRQQIERLAETIASKGGRQDNDRFAGALALQRAALEQLQEQALRRHEQIVTSQLQEVYDSLHRAWQAVGTGVTEQVSGLRSDLADSRLASDAAGATLQQQVNRMLGLYATIAGAIEARHAFDTSLDEGKRRLAELLTSRFPTARVQFDAELPGGGAKVPAQVRLPTADSRTALVPIYLSRAALEMESASQCPAADDAAPPAHGREDLQRRWAERILAEAREARAEWVRPPATTNFAILFFHSEEMFNQALGTENLADSLAEQCSVLAASPATLGALLAVLERQVEAGESGGARKLALSPVS